jgi:hypothetical protein
LCSYKNGWKGRDGRVDVSFWSILKKIGKWLDTRKAAMGARRKLVTVVTKNAESLRAEK